MKENNNNIDTIILANRWTSLITSLGYGVEITNSKDKNIRIFDSKTIGIEIKKKITEIASMGKKVVLIYPVPEAGEDVPNYIVKKKILTDPNFVFNIPIEDFNIRNDLVINILDSIDDMPTLIRVKPSELFCNTFSSKNCVTVLNGRSLYLDDDHLSNFGSSFIIESVFKKLN